MGPSPFGLSHLMLLIDCQHASGYVAQMGWRTCVFHHVTPARRAFVKTTGHSAEPRGKLGYQKVVRSNRKLDKWNVSPPHLLQFLAVRFALPCERWEEQIARSEILPPQFLCSLCPAGLSTGCLPVWLQDLPFVFIVPFLPRIKVALEIKHAFMACQALGG